MNNQFNTNSSALNKFNDLIEQASQALSCDAECMKLKEINKLKQNYINAQINLASAPAKVELAEKNFVVYTKGKVVYDELMDIKLYNKAQQIADKFTEIFDKEVAAADKQINNYAALLVNYKNVVDLYLKYRKENIMLFKKLKEQTNDVLTNERKTYYEDQQIDNLKFYYFYFLLTLYIICVICFAVFSLIYPSQMNWKVRLALLLLLLILPLISTRILGLIIYLFIQLYSLLPKNVYK